MKPFPSAALAGLAAIVVACAPANEMPGADEGQALFLENCAVCHSADGKGEGPMARSMATPPADLTLIAVRNGGVFPRAEVLSTIDGYTKADLNGPGMPEFGALLQGDLVPLDTGDGILTPTPRRLVAILEYLEAIQQTP